jgi:hypothetical protein
MIESERGFAMSLALCRRRPDISGTETGYIRYGDRIYLVKQKFSPGRNFFFRPKKHKFRNLKNHQKFNCGFISKKLGHVIDKHVSFHLIHKNLTFNIKVKRSRSQR